MSTLKIQDLAAMNEASREALATLNDETSDLLEAKLTSGSLTPAEEVKVIIVLRDAQREAILLRGAQSSDVTTLREALASAERERNQLKGEAEQLRAELEQAQRTISALMSPGHKVMVHV